MIGKYTIAFLLILLTTVCSHADTIDDILPYLIQVESGGNPNAVSHAGAVGLCQITPIVLKEYNQTTLKEYEESKLEYERKTKEKMENSEYLGLWTYDFYPATYEYVDLWDIKINVHIAKWYLRRLKDHYKCPDIERVLAAYNGGITRLRKNNYDINKMPRETRNYVKKVMKLYKGGK